MKTGKRKFLIALALFSAAAGLLTPQAGFSQGAPSTGGSSFWGGFAKGLAEPAMAIVYAFLLIIQEFLAYLLGLFGLALDNVLRWNVQFVPADFVVVQVGWTMLRDIANAFFILLILWVALTIIFGIERFGGKKLLFRIIAVALLINFSLAFVAATFGFANVFADAFYEGFPFHIDPQTGVKTPNIAGFLQDNLKFNMVFAPPDPATTQQALEQEQNNAYADYMAGVVQRGDGFDSKFAFASALGLKRTDAFLFAAPLIFLGKVAIGIGISWALGAAISAIWGSFATSALQLAMVDLLLFIAVATLAIVSVMLIMRIIAIMFLSITAPAAFFLHVVPGGLGKQYWNKWLMALFRWAFFAPAFFFLFYIALYFIAAPSRLAIFQGQSVNVGGVPSAFLLYLMAAGVMIASVVFARKIAGGTADLGLSFATKLASFALGGVAAGAATFIAKPALRTAQPYIEKAGKTVSQIPFVRRFAKPGLEMTYEHLAKEGEEVDELTKKYARYTPDRLENLYGASGFAKDKVAIAIALQEKDEFLKRLNPQQQQNSIRLAGQFNRQMLLLGGAPQYATPNNVPGVTGSIPGLTRDQEAIYRALKFNKDRAFLKKEAFLDTAGNLTPEGRNVVHGMWVHSDLNELARIGRQNTALMQQMVRYINDQGNVSAIKNAMRAIDGSSIRIGQIGRYLSGLGRGGGGRIGWDPGQWHHVPNP